MKTKSILLGMILFFQILLFAGCAAFRSEIKGNVEFEAEKKNPTGKISLLFVFSHYHQVKGFDAIPKLAGKNQRVSGFDDFLRDALKEFKSVEHYATFTEYPSDVNDPERRAEKDSLIKSYDYVLKMEFLEEVSFPKYMLGGIFSTLSATLLPVPYTKSYSVKAQLFNRNGQLINTYTRHASITKWVELFLIFAYPFYPEKREIEEVYLGFLHNIFKQIEHDNALI